MLQEHSFEVSLFAEVFNEMLMRDAGFAIYRSLVDAPEKAKEEKKSKDKKEEEKKEGDDEKKKEDKESKKEEVEEKKKEEDEEGSGDGNVSTFRSFDPATLSILCCVNYQLSLLPIYEVREIPIYQFLTYFIYYSIYQFLTYLSVISYNYLLPICASLTELCLCYQTERLLMNCASVTEP